MFCFAKRGDSSIVFVIRITFVFVSFFVIFFGTTKTSEAKFDVLVDV